MLKSNPTLRLAICFPIIFGMLLIPWQGLNVAYRSLFQAQARWVSACLPDRIIPRVGDHTDPGRPSIDVEVTLTERRSIRADGTANGATVLFDSRSMGWMPNAMVLALLLATGLPKKQLWKSILFAIVVTNTVVTFGITFSLIDNLPQSRLSDWASYLISAGDDIFCQSLWFSFIFPALLWWTVVTFHSTKYGTGMPFDELLRPPTRRD
jgi:hypothetical protein